MEGKVAKKGLLEERRGFGVFGSVLWRRLDGSVEEVEKLENGLDGDVDVSAERDEIGDRDDRDGSVESVEEEREIEERR